MRARTPLLTPTPRRRQDARRPAWWIAVVCVFMLASGLFFVAVRPAAAAPRLTVTSPVTVGDHLTLLGAGFASNAHVEVHWEGMDVALAGVRADATGRFELIVTVPEELETGSYEVTATERDAAPGQDRSVVATLEVVAASGAVMATPHVGHATVEDPDSGTHRHSSEEELELPVARALPDERPAPTSGDHQGHQPASAPPAPADPAGTPDHGSHQTNSPEPSPPHAHGGNVASSGDPVDCTGYPEPRTFLEVHAWWEGDPLADGQIAHLHAGTCFPLGQTVSGSVAFDVRIVMHDNPGDLYRYETGLHTDGHGEGDLSVIGLDQRCESTCEFWVHTVIDTSRANDGWHEIRVKPRVQLASGEVLLTSTGWPIRTENGNPDGGFRDSAEGPSLGITGRGWYDGHGYQNPVLTSPEGVLPGQVVSGVWQPTVRLDAGSEGAEPTFTGAYVDPDFHHNDEDSDGGGIVIGTWDGEYRGPITIDTRHLSNGRHTLVLRVEAKADGTRLTGLQYVPIIVRN